MFRPLLGHLHALWENRSNSYLYFNALWDPKCLQIILQECKIHKLYIQKFIPQMLTDLLQECKIHKLYTQTYIFYIHVI